MERLTLQATLGGIAFTAIWTALSLLLGPITVYQLVLGLLAGLAFGGGWYWIGSHMENSQSNS